MPAAAAITCPGCSAGRAIGPLIGKRTWGGLVGIGGYPVLIDGGSVTAPHFAFYSPEGEWEVENRGVSPDIEVEMDPKAWRQGRDPQLEKAVEVVMSGASEEPAKAERSRPVSELSQTPPVVKGRGRGTANHKRLKRKRGRELSRTVLALWPIRILNARGLSPLRGLEFLR